MTVIVISSIAAGLGIWTIILVFATIRLSEKWKKFVRIYSERISQLYTFQRELGEQIADVTRRETELYKRTAELHKEHILKPVKPKKTTAKK